MKLYEAKVSLDPKRDWTPIQTQHAKIKEVFTGAPPKDRILPDAVHFEFMAMGLVYAQLHLLKVLPYFSTGIRECKRKKNGDFCIRKDGAILTIEEIEPKDMTDVQESIYFPNVCEIANNLFRNVLGSPPDLFDPNIILQRGSDLSLDMTNEIIGYGGGAGGRPVEVEFVRQLHQHMDEYSKKWKPYKTPGE